MPIDKESLGLLSSAIRELAADLEADAKRRQGIAPDKRDPIPADQQAAILKELLRGYQSRASFRVGDILRWKRGMKNRRFPEVDQPVVVVEVVSPGVVNPIDDAGSAYFREILDVRLGLLNERGEFVIYSYDSARFERWMFEGVVESEV